MKKMNRIKMWFSSKLKRKVVKVTDEIYGIKIKDNNYTFVHIPESHDYMFDYIEALQYMKRLGDNKVTIDEDKLQQEKDWIDKELDKKPKVEDEDKEV